MRNVLIGLIICIVIEAVLICELIYRVNGLEDDISMASEQITYIEGEINEHA